MNADTYEIGYALGRHWALRDATEDQLRKVKKIGPGSDWVANQADAAGELSALIDPLKDGFLSIAKQPSKAFVAGLVDGAQTVGTE